ncbi:MAG: response regulator [Phreatobacter sp.]|jgi:CheY-like chemotaxis protein|uniref:response regulator n=1 Tax=Phreatobacter sp. TaxID=1966341 RepID=UPI0040359038
MNILVVDDVPAMQVSIAAALEAAGHTVSTASSGSRALACVEDGDFDVIVTDIWMPDGDGLRLIKQVRERPDAPRVIVITGGGPKLSIELAGSLAEVWGADHVLVKPFDDRRLVALVEGLRPPG